VTVVGIDHLQLAMPAGREAKKAHPGLVVSDLNALVKTLKVTGRVVSDGDVRERTSMRMSRIPSETGLN